MDRMKKIANSIGKIVKSLGIKVFQELRRDIIQKWNEKEPKEHYFQLGKLSIIALIMILVYTSFFAMEKTAEESPVLVEEPKVPDMLRIVETGDFSNLDSVLVNDQSALNVLNNVMEGLMRLDQNNKPTYGMAEKVEISPDYKTYTFTIRKDAKWSDGKPVTAEDFYFAWMRAIDPTTDSKNSYLFDNIEGVKGYRNGESKEIGLKILQNNILRVKLNKPDINFKSLVCHPAFGPQRKDIFEKSQTDYATSIESLISNGPFKIEKFEFDYLNLVKNDNYWNGDNVNLISVQIKKNLLEKVVQYYNANEIDITPITKKIDHPNYLENELATTVFLKVNLDMQLENRELLSKSIKNIINFKNTTLIPRILGVPSRLVLTSKLKTQFPNQSLQLNIRNKEESNRIASLVSKQLLDDYRLKIDLQTKSSYFELNQAERKGEFDLSLSNWLAEYQEPLTFLNIFTTNAKENTIGYSNPRFDQLVEEAHQELDSEKQAKLIAEAENILVNEDIVVIPLYHVTVPRLQKPYVQGVVYHPYGAEYSLKWAQIKEIK